MRCQTCGPSADLCQGIGFGAGHVFARDHRSLHDQLADLPRRQWLGLVDRGDGIVMDPNHLPADASETFGRRRFPLPVALRSAVCSKTSLADIEATGRASVAPYGVCTSPAGAITCFICRSTRGGTGAPADRTRCSDGKLNLLPLHSKVRRRSTVRASRTPE